MACWASHPPWFWPHHPCAHCWGTVPLFSFLCHVCEKAEIILFWNDFIATAETYFYLFWFNARKKEKDFFFSHNSLIWSQMYRRVQVLSLACCLFCVWSFWKYIILLARCTILRWQTYNTVLNKTHYSHSSCPGRWPKEACSASPFGWNICINSAGTLQGHCVWCHSDHLGEAIHCFSRGCSVDAERWDHMSLPFANIIATASDGQIICLLSLSVMPSILMPWQLQSTISLFCQPVQPLWKNTTMKVSVTAWSSACLWALLSGSVGTSAPHDCVANETVAPMMTDED